MKAGGYFTGIRGKVSHSSPYQPFAWDAILDTLPDGTKAHIKDVQSYGAATTAGIAQAKAAKKPFCLVVNISDPHKPFWKARMILINLPAFTRPTRCRFPVSCLMTRKCARNWRCITPAFAAPTMPWAPT